MSSSKNNVQGSPDIYLAVVGKKQGALKGECQVPHHLNEISVMHWTWGMTASLAAGSTQATGRRIHAPLIVTKKMDAASTKLMNALSQNEELKSITLSMRKGGMGDEDFCSVKLEKARLADIHLSSDETGSVIETLRFSYQKIEVTYYAQQDGGGRSGGMTFQDELVDA
jgi:type VI secretion system secreted protein Hcp